MNKAISTSFSRRKAPKLFSFLKMIIFTKGHRNKMMLTAGTSGRNAIQGFGGFNVSEFNIQRHRPKDGAGNYSEQDRTAQKFAGRNPMNPPKATDSGSRFKGGNTNYEWRERTLKSPLPGQVAGGFGKLPYGSADTSLLQWKLRHGLGSNDPSLVGMIDERQIAPKIRADWQWQSESYLHSDIGVPSVLTQNMHETPTQNVYPANQKVSVRGTHDHTNLTHHTRPTRNYDSNTASGNHHSYGSFSHPGVEGFRATKGPLERPLLLSDLPQPAQPMPVY